ncbi:MAG TPA: DUF4268 domain-containing protein [Propionibacteriaceae bacterium]
MTSIGSPLQFGSLKRLDPKTLWPKEAYDFTPWLAQNLEALGEALSVELELDETEAACGDFSLDILARDLNRDHIVVIENQLTPTDHDHLGKLITYAAGYDAGSAVWVAPEFREEHREALDWLNRRSDSETNFFGVVVEALQIDSSLPAYNFRPVAMPNEWRKTKVGGAAPSSKAAAYQEFFQQLIDELREKKFTGARIGQPQNWYSFASGVSGVTYTATFAQHGRVRAEYYISGGDSAANKAQFDALENHRTELEEKFGEPLTWERLNDRIASRISVSRPGSIDDSGEELAEVREWLVGRLFALKDVFGPTLKGM